MVAVVAYTIVANEGGAASVTYPGHMYGVCWVIVCGLDILQQLSETAC